MFHLANISGKTWIGMVLGLGTLWLSLDGLHYWHDIRFAYAATNFSISEILLGEFHPEQLGGGINEQVAGGFYLAKVLHLWLLHSIFEVVPPDNGGFNIVVGLFVCLMGVWTYVGYHLWKSIFDSEWLGWLAWICMLIVPVTPYLSGKLLSEVPSLVCITLSLLTLFHSRSELIRKRLLLGIISGLCLLLAGLFRLDSVLVYFGFCLSIIWYAESSKERGYVVGNLFMATTILLVGYCCLLWIWNVSPEILFAYFKGFTQAGQKSVLMSILGVITFGGVVFLLAISSYFQDRRLSKFCIAWFVISCGPIMIIAWQYMIEPRYLINGVLPLVGLGALGLDYIIRRIPLEGILRQVFTAVSILLVLGLNILFVRLMPYELDRVSLTKTVNTILQQNQRASILIPWTYTDFHFLRMMFPEASIKNVHTPHGGTEVLSFDPKWEKRLSDWYGDAFTAKISQVIPLWERGKVFYVSWTYYPPVEFVKRVSEVLGLSFLSRKIGQLDLLNHQEESWLWGYPGLKFSPVGEIGQYSYFSLTQKKCSSNAPTASKLEFDQLARGEEREKTIRQRLDCLPLN